MIFGADPGLNFGWAVVRPRPVEIVDLGVLAPAGNPEIEIGTDRARRAAKIVRGAEGIIRGHGCTMIAAESVLGFGSVHAVLPQALVYAGLLGLAVSLDIDFAEVKARDWQHELLPHRAGKRINYDEVVKVLADYVGPRITKIDPEQRTHAYDGGGIGMYAALTPVVLIHRGRARRERDQQRAEIHVEPTANEGATDAG